MKSKMKVFSKAILAIFVLIVSFFGSICNANAANQITLGQSERLDGYVAGTYFSIKQTTSGVYVYCLDIHKGTAKNSVANFVREKDAGFAAILKNGYPNKSFTGDRKLDYYITQAAVWWYLDDTTGSSNLRDAFKTNGKDPYGLRPHIKNLVAIGKAARSKGYGDLSVKSLSVADSSMSLESNGKYYTSQAIALNGSNVDSYSVSVSGAPSGTIITDVSGNQKSKFSANEKFKVKVLASKVTGTKLSMKVTATATRTIQKAYEYQPVDTSMQSVMPANLTSVSTTKSVSTNLEIATSKVTIVKLDKKTNQALAGAVLAIRDANGKEITSWTTTTNAHVIRNLSNGTYTLVEKSAPKGYKLNSESVKFTVSDSNRDVSVKFYNEAKSSVVTITKVDESTGDALAGAVLVVKDANGKEVARFTTTTESYVLVDLAEGTYMVEEISAPAGYQLNSEKISFTIDEDHLSHQITFKNYPEVSVPNTSSNGSMIFTILGMLIVASGIGFVYKNAKQAK